MSQSSPRPSVDSHSHGPFHSLTQRFRKGSSASSQNSESTSAPPVTVNPMSKTDASRAARRMILSLVRDDWDWPHLPPEQPAESTDRPSIPHREPSTYRLREEAQSDIDADEHRLKRRLDVDPYKFESPDAVGATVVDRKTKRRKMLEEELTFNPGLKTWQERRDAWTGALQHKPHSNKPTERRPSMAANNRPSYRSRLSNVFVREKVPEDRARAKTHSHSASQSTDGGGSASWPASPTSPTPEHSSIDSVDASSPGITSRTTTNTTVEANTPLTPSSTIVPPSSLSSEPGPWLPIYPPILARDDIVRDRIKPTAYPTIYSKIVVQGLAPNVSIPLCHMITALVEGWKSEGNWPPQPSAPLAADVKRGLRSSTFAKWRKDHTDKQKGADATAAGSSNQVRDDETGNRSSLRRSMGMMRKVGSYLGGPVSSTDGLDELGIEFNEKDQGELGRNVTLNRGLAH